MKTGLMALLALMISTSAVARTNNGPYVAVRFAGTDMQAEMDGIASSKEKSDVFSYGSALGIRSRNIRAEMEWMGTSRADYGEDYTYLQQRLMLQLYYDIPLRSAIRPFVNVGAGMAHTELKPRYSSSSRYKDDGTSFAWNAGAGVTIAINQAINVDIGYRYVNAGEKEFYDWPKLKMQSHEGYLGFRYTF